MPALIVVEDLVGQAVVGRGGHALHVLQFLEGLRRLGHDVLFIEFIDRPPDSTQRAYWQSAMEEWWFPGRASLLDAETGEGYLGAPPSTVLRHVEQSKAVIQLAASYRSEPWPLIADVRPRIIIDGDPGYTHLWAVSADPDEIWGPQDVYLTVGLNIGTSRSNIPAAGLEWHRVPNWVLPDWWSGDVPIARDRFTTVAGWRDYGYLEFEGRLLGPKSEEFERFLSLPSLAGESLELALALEPDDPDTRHLQEHGWLVESASVVRTVDGFRNYVSGSLGEFSCAKGGYVGTQSGWFSDRSACYLAAGRPVILQSTGFEEVLPTGTGLLAVRSPEEAAAAIRTVRRDYAAHSRAAREIATTYLDVELVTRRVLEAAGIEGVGTGRRP